MVIEIKQTWWHIEEIYFPHAGRKIRQVMDIYIDEQYLPISLDSNEYLGFRIYARNANNKELAYLEYKPSSNSNNCCNEDESYNLIVNLGSLIDYPAVEDEDNENLKHVKIEFEYIQMHPIIYEHINSGFEKIICDYIRPKRLGFATIRGNIQPEFYVTLPLGWRIGNVELLDTYTENEGTKCAFGEKQGSSIKIIELEKPFISIIDGKRKYNYVINNLAKTRPDANKKPVYAFSYLSVMSYKMVGLSLMPHFFLFVMFFITGEIVYNRIFNSCWLNLGLPVAFSYLISMLAYCYFYTTFIKEGYYIPHSVAFKIASVGSLVLILFIICIELFLSSNLESLVTVSINFFN